MPTTLSPPAPSEAAAPRLIALFCRVRPERIGRLRDILEGYDGLAFLSTLDPASGLARLYVPAGSYADVLLLLEALAPGLNPWTQGNVIRLGEKANKIVGIAPHAVGPPPRPLSQRERGDEQITDRFL